MLQIWSSGQTKQVLIKLDWAVWIIKHENPFWWLSIIISTIWIQLSLRWTTKPNPLLLSLLFFPWCWSPSCSVASLSTQTDEEPELIEMLQTRALVSNNITLSRVTSTCPASLYAVPVSHSFSHTDHCYRPTHLHNVREIPNSNMNKFQMIDWSSRIDLGLNHLEFKKCHLKSKSYLFCWMMTVLYLSLLLVFREPACWIQRQRLKSVYTHVFMLCIVFF